MNKKRQEPCVRHTANLRALELVHVARVHSAGIFEVQPLFVLGNCAFTAMPINNNIIIQGRRGSAFEK